MMLTTLCWHIPDQSVLCCVVSITSALCEICDAYQGCAPQALHELTQLMQILRVSGADLEARLKVALYDLLQSVNLDVCLVLICIMCMHTICPKRAS